MMRQLPCGLELLHHGGILSKPKRGGGDGTYFVRGNATKLPPGMCFSDEPGIYIYGELGIRHEDTIFIGEAGAENLTAGPDPPRRRR